jgi:hypothetical protein
MEKVWYQAWKGLPQEQIQQWISAISYHIKEIIRLKGDNEYKEGFKRSWAGTQIKGKLSTLQFIDRKQQHQAQNGENSDSEASEDVDDKLSAEEVTNSVINYGQFVRALEQLVYHAKVSAIQQLLKHDSVHFPLSASGPRIFE